MRAQVLLIEGDMQLESYHIYGAVFIAYMVIKEVFVLVKGESKEILKKVSAIFDRMNEVKTLNEAVSEIRYAQKERDSIFLKLDSTIDKIDDLYEWHNKEDADGVRIWYVRSSLQKSLDNLRVTLQKEHELVSALVKKLSFIESDVDEIKRELDIRN